MLQNNRGSFSYLNGTIARNNQLRLVGSILIITDALSIKRNVSLLAIIFLLRKDITW